MGVAHGGWGISCVDTSAGANFAAGNFVGGTEKAVGNCAEHLKCSAAHGPKTAGSMLPKGEKECLRCLQCLPPRPVPSTRP